MRPVNKSTLPSPSNGRALKASQLGDLLLATVGEYCSFCERALDDPIIIQDKRSEQSVFSLSDWNYLLLSCPDCYASAEQAYLDKQNWKTRSLWPDADATFTLDSRSPFQYILQTVNVVYVTPLGERTTLSSEQQVIVKPGTASTSNAQATIDLFALNSIYYDATSNTMSIPVNDYQVVTDQRVRQRTNVWQLAQNAVTRLRNSRDNALVYNLMCEQITATAMYSGFWSTWMTVFWSAFQDGDLLTRLFIETAKMAGFVFTGSKKNFVSGGTFNYFPGTDKSKILQGAQGDPSAGG
ncbi:MAG TPA: hypothetical protein VGV59_19915 [Pyrinomonadaceae bacterium]|nr:hypothetical protein [Pyrinomonadaceae bacterium]